jgi:hypothetical protein
VSTFLRAERNISDTGLGRNACDVIYYNKIKIIQVYFKCTNYTWWKALQKMLMYINIVWLISWYTIIHHRWSNNCHILKAIKNDVREVA